MSRSRPATVIKVAAIVIALGAIVIAGQAALIFTRSDDTLIELAKAQTKVERDLEKARMDPRLMNVEWAPRVMTDGEIDAAISRQELRQKILDQISREQDPKTVPIKGGAAALLFAVAFLAWTGRRPVARVLGGITGVLIGLASLGSLSEYDKMAALYRYYEGPFLHPLLDRAAIVALPAAALACLVTAFFWRDRKCDHAWTKAADKPGSMRCTKCETTALAIHVTESRSAAGE